MDVVIIKLGTQSVWTPGVPDVVAQTCVSLRDRGVGTVLVSSGAMFAGAQQLGYTSIHEACTQSRISEPTLSGYGTQPLLQRWRDALQPKGLHPLPLWVTHSNMDSEHEQGRIAAYITETLHSPSGIVVANENDPVSSKEINFMHQGLGENDRLTVRLVELMQNRALSLTINGAYFATHTGGVWKNSVNREGGIVNELSCAYRPGVSPQCSDAIVKNDLLSEHKVPNNMNAKVCAATRLYRYGVPHVGIGYASEAYSFFSKAGDFTGTTITN